MRLLNKIKENIIAKTAVFDLVEKEYENVDCKLCKEKKNMIFVLLL